MLPPPMRLNLNLSRALTLLGACLGAGTLALTSCAGGDAPTGPLVVATTGHIHDALVALTRGTEIEVKVLCGPGVDPHSYSATTKDVLAMQRADAVIYNGFHLEAQLGEVLTEASLAPKSWAMSERFPAEARLDWLEDGEVDPDAPFDPHIWNHLPGWSECVSALAGRLASVYPEYAGAFASNGQAYMAEIAEADAWAEAQLSKIPKAQRVLVSGHDAFQYFVKRYDMETLAVLGVGNDPEADIRTMQSVAREVTERKVPVVFLESITNPKVTQALVEACASQGHTVRIAQEPLYSDDLGDTPPVHTYLGAFRWNVEAIVASLGGGA